MTSPRSVLARSIAVTALAILAIGTAPATASAQKALVYCPASIDVTGCDNTITALGTAFPGGVDRGYDGSSGTMDMRTIDLWSYAVIVVPSLADGSGGLPYAFLRDTAVSGKLHAAIMGRIALWSGTPDQGTANRTAKNSLLQSLAHWAQGNYATVKGPGLVALQDLSDTVSHRYDWLHGITGLTITADSAVYSYASVGAVTATGTAILTDATGATIAYSNMASLGFFLPQGAAGLHLDAVGQTGTSQGGQVVLATSSGGNTGTAAISTDRDDYAPGTTVTITGHGFQPGETVTISFAEQPAVDVPSPITVVADGTGSFVNASFSPDAQDAGTRFIATAVGKSSGMQAQATFTDAVPSTVTFAAQSPAQVVGGADASFVVSVKFGGNSGAACTAQMSASPGTSPVWPVGATFGFAPTSVTGTSGATAITTLTVHTPSGMQGATYGFTVTASGSCQGNGQQSATGTGSLLVITTANTTLSSSATPSAFGQTVTFTATLVPSTATGTIQFTDGGTNLGAAQTITGGSASLATAALSVGAHTIGAIYTPGNGYAAGTVAGLTQTVGKAAATVALSNLAQTYTGSPLSATASTTPTGLSVAITYNGASQAPTAAGSYTVVGTVNDPNYQGSATGTLVIAPASQAPVTLTSVPGTPQPYQGTFTVGASGGGGTGAYSFGATGVCTVNATTGVVTMTSGTGTCSLTASRAGDGNYNASAPSAPGTVTAALATQAALSVTGMPATAEPFATQFTVGAAGGSGGGSVTFAASGACSVNATSGVVSMTSGTGTCSVNATRAGDTNYSPITSSPATVAATKATQIISWAAPAPITYGTSLAGVLNATITTGDGTLSYDHAATETPTPGALTITATASATTNYNSATAQVVLTVNKATLTPSVTAQNKVYDGTTAAQASGTLAGTLGSDAVTLGIGSAAFADRNVGTGKTVTVGGLTLGGAQAGYYLLSTTSATTTADITRASLTVTASSPSSIVYGSAAPAVTPNFSSFATGDDASAVTGLTCGTSYVAGANVGNYTTTCSGGVAANYTLAYLAGSFGVTKASLSVTANDKSRVYGSANPALDGTLLGVFGSDGITASYATTAVQGSDVGTYPITPSLSDPNSKLGNYTVTSTNGTLTITKAPLSVTASDATREYGDPNPTFTGTLTGIVNSDAITATFGTAADPTSSVGNYPITPTLSDPGSRLGNYNLTSTNGTLKITPAPLSVTPANAQRLYGAANPVLTGTVTGVKNADPITASYATIAVPSTAVGAYDITATLSDPSSKLGNYAITLNKGTLTVNPAPLAVSADDASRTYGAANPTFTASYSGFVLGETPGVLGGTIAFATPATPSTAVGTYAITPSGVTSTNYAITFANGTLTIKPAPLTVKADDATRTYGDANPSFTASYSGFVLGETSSVLGGTLAFTTPATAASDVGTFPVTPNGVTSSNYAVTFANGTLTVTQAPLSVTPANAKRLYGGANPAFTGTVTGIKNADPITASYATAATPATGVGTYDITATLADPSSKLGNYAVTLNKGTLTIDPAPLTVKADDATRVYGDPNPTFTGTLTGIQNSDAITATYASAADPTSGVGTYPVTPSLADPGSKLGNYTVTSTNGTLTVTKAPLMIAAGSTSRTYGAQNPTFTGTITGLKNSDAITATYSSAATQQDHVGTYAIVPAAVDASPPKLANYTVTLTNGTLTITQATPTITWATPTAIPQGTALSTTQLNASASGVFNESVSGTFTYNPPAGTVEYYFGPAALGTTFTSTNTDYTGATKSNSVQVNNVAPTVTSITLAAAPVPVNQSVSIQAAFSDPGIYDTWNATVTWDDGNTSQGTVSNGTVTASHTFTTAGVYTITVSVSDNNGGTGTLTSSLQPVGYIVVYDPSAGFVTGGGWINSPSGACRLTTICTGATGKANFGFNARYQKGANVPDGTTEFQFQAGGLNFHSTVYQWLVVAGTKAQYKGSGTVNGVAGYGFLLTAIDGTQKGNPDAFRIKITDPGGVVVYDNQMGSADDSDNATTLGGGSIVIH